MKIYQCPTHISSIPSADNAPFNRDYLWTEDDVIALFNSFIKGYPVGSFIFWDNKGEATILDGNNRLSTLNYARTVTPGNPLTGAPKSVEDVWGRDKYLTLIFHEGDIPEFKFMTTEEMDDAHGVPVYALIGNKMFHPFFRARPIDYITDNQMTLCDAYQHNIMHAPVIQTVIEGTAYEAVDTFCHLARAGQPMPSDVIEQALAWAKNQDAQDISAPRI